MRKTSERDYYERRARSEIRKANMTDDPTAKRVHLALATSYLKHSRETAEEPQLA